MKWSDLKAIIQREYDIEDENFITPQELMNFVNEAIDEAESEILNLNQGKYLETLAEIDLVKDQSTYTLPSGIFATKVIKLLYKDESSGQGYEIEPVKDLLDTISDRTGCGYKFRIDYIASGANKGYCIKLYPTPDQNLVGGLKLYYQRNASKIVDDDSEFDLPEAIGFIQQFVIDKCANKERMTPDAPESAALKRKRIQLIETLERQLPGDNNTYPVNLEFFEDHN